MNSEINERQAMYSSSFEDPLIPDAIVQPEKEVDKPARNKVSIKAIITLIVLVFINLLNYMDRYTIAGVLTLITKYFKIDSKTAGLLQTVFTCSYMVFAPIFGYLGDRYSRKYVMAIGILIWSVTTFLGSLVNKDQVVWFFIIRGMVGIGEASYSTVAPTIIADLFIGDQRTKALSLFYFAIPCGSGLGYIVGSQVARLAHQDWQYAFKVTPGLGILCVIMCVFIIHEPKRGAIETGPQEAVDEYSASIHHQSSSYLDDLKYIFRVKSFVFASIGFTCVTFVVGSLAFWAPEFVLYSEKINGKPNTTIDQVSYIFGIITFVTGIIGVWTGAEIARRWRKTNMKSDALVCGIGIFASVPFLFLALYVMDKMIYVSWVLIAVGEIFLCLNWAPNADLLLYVIVPSRRSTAEAVQILFIHLFGDAISPFIVGAIADAVQDGDKSDEARQKALLYALFMTPFICVFGAISYHFCAEYLTGDKEAAESSTKKKADDDHEKVMNTLPPSPNESVHSNEFPRPEEVIHSVDNRTISVECTDQCEELGNDNEPLIPTTDFPNNEKSSNIII